MPNSSSDKPEGIVLGLTMAELKALYKVLEFQYIPHDNRDAHTVINKIALVVRDYEQQLARLSSRATQGA